MRTPSVWTGGVSRQSYSQSGVVWTRGVIEHAALTDAYGLPIAALSDVQHRQNRGEKCKSYRNVLRRS